MKDFYVVMDAKVIKVTSDVFKKFTYYNEGISLPIEGTDDSILVTEEVVHGRRFCRTEPQLDVIIGWDSKLQELLGVPMDAWESYQSELVYKLKVEKSILEIGIKDMRSRVAKASLFDRIKYLFTRHMQGVT